MNIKSEIVQNVQFTCDAELYGRHVNEKMRRLLPLFTQTGYSSLVIASGEIKTHFQDDIQYCYKPNPYFKEWVPLNRRPGSFLQLKPGAHKPCLFLLCAEDIWHTEPQSLPRGFSHYLEIVGYKTLEELTQLLNLKGANSAYIGEANLLGLPQALCNPLTVLNYIDYHRRFKTVYEQFCVREANRLAIPAHLAAQQTFMAGGSELQVCAAYLEACDSSESDMPYPVIAGINEHAAVLHHFHLDRQKPKNFRSLLLDAGVDFRGYASDITRTYAFDPDSEFAEMIGVMDENQLQLIAAGVVGKSPYDLHLLAHKKVAEVLIQFGIITCSVDAAVQLRITDTFFPHGLGHHLGSSVHDKGSQLASPRGDVLPPPEGYPTVRNTVPMVASQVYTVEPGLYFIPALLDKLRKAETHRQVNWARIEDFVPFGGIRIEDNIIMHSNNELENLTRDAFSHHSH